MPKPMTAMNPDQPTALVRKPPPAPILPQLLGALLWAVLGISALVYVGEMGGMVARSGSSANELHGYFLALTDTIMTTGAALCMAVAAAALYIGPPRIPAGRD